MVTGAGRPAPRPSLNSRYGPRQRLGLAGGPLLFLLMLLLPPGGMEPQAARAAAVAVLMATWWVTEAIPIPATALLPLALFPLLQVASIDQAAAPYANPLIFLFLGGFMLALAMQRWGLHRRIALTIISRMGTRPASLVAGFMAATALLSAWVSNTATVVMMLPIGLSVIEMVERRGDGAEGPGDLPGGQPPQTNFGTSLMLGIAYAASVGGLATLIGTPPNAMLAGFFRET
jgi:solute carrier family 13 (sodium-dependent dicarboxylate transporter), member 2/3/5